MVAANPPAAAGSTAEAAPEPARPERATPAAAPVGRARPRWLWQVCLATAAYLVVELAFNARLLDVVGGGASAEEIDRIEIWGRVISGFALALVFWPAIITRAARKSSSSLRRGWSLASWTLVAVIAMYAGQEALLGHLVDRSTPEQLRTAQHLVLLQSGISNGAAYVDSLELDAARLETAEGKATLALLPILASHLPDVGGAFSDQQRSDVSRGIILSRMGDPGERVEQYSMLVQALHAAYDAFPKAANAPARDRRLQQSLARAQLSTTVGAMIPGVADIILPDTFELFVTDPLLNAELHRTVGYSCMQPLPGHASSDDEFMDRVFNREVACLLARQAGQVGDPDAGRTARRALLVPFIALAFSLLGALAHVTKLSLYVLTLIRGHPLFRRRGRFAQLTLVLPALLVTAFAWGMSSQTTRSPAYDQLEAHTGLVMRTMIRGTIHGQMVGYPIFEGVRVNLLGGFTFGYKGDDQVGGGERESGVPGAEGGTA